MRLQSLLIALLLAGCDQGRPVSDDLSRGAEGGGSCVCAPTITGTLDGDPVTFGHALFGVVVTWGTHAHPVSPQAAIAMQLLITQSALSCPSDGSELDTSGLHLIGIDLQPAQQTPTLLRWWSDPPRTYVDAAGELCLTTVPAQRDDPLGWPPQVSRPAAGCLSLRFTSDKGAAGQASGGFTASHCHALDGQMGE